MQPVGIEGISAWHGMQWDGMAGPTPFSIQLRGSSSLTFRWFALLSPLVICLGVLNRASSPLLLENPLSYCHTLACLDSAQ